MQNPKWLLYPTNWNVRFLCDCKRKDKDKEVKVHIGVAKKLSTQRVSLVSDHQICQNKKIVMQLTIPSLWNGDTHKVIKVIGFSLGTIVKDSGFVTEISFLHFEDDGRQILEQNLHHHFG
jgi:hypothetical protein